MGKHRATVLLGLFLGLCCALRPNIGESAPVRRIALNPSSDWVFSILVAPGSTCSFRLPLQVKHILLGNTRKFTATAIDSKIVAIKPKSAENNLFTTLQIVLEDGRIVTANVGIGPPESATQEVVFYWKGRSPAELALKKKEKQLEKKYKRKEKSLSDSFEATELHNYMQDILHAYDFRYLSGGKIRDGIGIFPQGLTRRGKSRAFVRFRIENRSDEDYHIAQLQMIHRREGGFLWMSTKSESVIESRLLCDEETNVIKAKTEQWCVVTFEIPERTSKHWQVAMKLTEAATKQREVYLYRVKELYE